MKQSHAVILAVLLAAGTAGAGDESYAGEVTASELNLRSGPGEAYQSVVRVPKGTKLVVTGTGAPQWLRVEVPQGYHAWVFARLIAPEKDGTGTLAADSVLVRPTASTRYNELDGRLQKGERVVIVGEQRTDEGTWYKIAVPRRFPLFAHVDYVKRIGPAALAEAAAEEKPAAAAPLETDSDRKFLEVESDVRQKLPHAKTTAEITPLRKAVAEVDREALSLPNRERRVKLLADLVETERKLSIHELQSKETEVRSDLDAKLKEIQRNYEKRLREIRDEFEKQKKAPFTATGIVEWRPDIVARHPSYRLMEAGKMRYFLISTEYDLGRFVGRRVGVSGLVDPESGTGYETIIIKRIEILGDQ